MPTQIVDGYTLPIENLGGARVIDRSPSRTVWVLVYNAGQSRIEFWYSTDDGSNWNHGSGDLTFSTDLATFFIDVDGYAHLLMDNPNASGHIYRRGTPNAAGTGWTWGSSVVVSTTSGGSSQHVSIVAHREGTGWKAHMVFGTLPSGNGTVRYERLNIAADGTVTSDGVGTDIKSAAAVNFRAEIDFRHTGDGKTAHATPNIYVSYVQGSGSVFFKKGTYSAGTWSWGSERTLDANAPVISGTFGMRFDGTRIVTCFVRSASTTVARVVERDEADTANTANDPTALADGVVNSLTISARSNGDIYLAASGATSSDPKYIRYNRGGTAWGGAWTTIETTTMSSTSVMCLGCAYDDMEVVYSTTATTPIDGMYERLALTHAGQASLQGVGSASVDASIGHNAQASLQGVGSISPTGVISIKGEATLQGVGVLSPSSDLIPFRDFTVYDGYLAGADLPEAMGLIYFEGEGFRNTEESQPLRPARSDIGNQPTEVRPESGEIFSQQDFSNGAGQLYYHHEGRDVNRYLWSEGFDVDIDTVGRPATLVHLHDVPAPAYASVNVADIVIFNDLPFVVDGTTFRMGNGDFPGFWTSEDPQAAESAVTIQDAVSSGEYLYAALGVNGIHRRSTAGAWTHWNDVQATRVAWVKNRIIAADGRSIYEVISAGAAPTAIETLPVGWTFQDIFEVSGFVYAVASNATASLARIHAYGLNEGGTAIEKKSETPFPNDQLLLSGVGYLDTAFIGGGIRTPEGGYDPVVYQAQVVDRDRGALSYAKVTEGEGAGSQDLSVLAFEPVGENVLCGWSLGSSFPFGARDGLALYKLKNGAFFPYLKTAGAGTGKQVSSIASYKGRILFTTRGGGLYYEEPTKYVSSAYLISSVADWNTTAEKVWDTVQLSHNPLPQGTSVAIDYRTQLLNPTEQWVQALSNSTEGQELDEARFTELSTRLLAVRIRSFASSDQLRAPSGHGFLVRSNVLPDEAEWRLTRYIRILKADRKDARGEDVFIADTHVRKRDIQLTTYKWITLYEPGVIWTCRVAKIANITPLIPQYDETLGEERADAYVMQLTLEGVRD